MWSVLLTAMPTLRGSDDASGVGEGVGEGDGLGDGAGLGSGDGLGVGASTSSKAAHTGVILLGLDESGYAAWRVITDSTSWGIVRLASTTLASKSVFSGRSLVALVIATVSPAVLRSLRNHLSFTWMGVGLLECLSYDASVTSYSPVGNDVANGPPVA